MTNDVRYEKALYRKRLTRDRVIAIASDSEELSKLTPCQQKAIQQLAKEYADNT